MPCPPSSGRHRCGALSKKIAHPLERAGVQAVVRVRAALLAREESGVDELLQVVAHRRLLDPEKRLELTHTDGLAVSSKEAVEDLEAMAVGQRLEQTLELGRFGRRKRRAGDRRTALDQWKLFHEEA
jgi:hypothetical protein